MARFWMWSFVGGLEVKTGWRDLVAEGGRVDDWEDVVDDENVLDVDDDDDEVAVEEVIDVERASAEDVPDVDRSRIWGVG